MIKILLDGASDITAAEAEAHGWLSMPISVSLDGEEVGSLPFDEFYGRLEDTDEFPLTSQPSPHGFVEIFEKAQEDGDQIIYLALSSRLSGTYQSACLAKEIVGYDGIHIVNTRTATQAIYLLACVAQDLIDEGHTVDEVVKRIERLKSRVRIIAALDTLEYLARGGRIPPAAAAVGDLARLKPVISVSAHGEVEVLAKSLGINKALGQVAKLVEARGVDTDYPVFAIHTKGDENPHRLDVRLERVGIVPEELRAVGPTIGSHIGPGAAGLVFVSH